MAGSVRSPSGSGLVASSRTLRPGRAAPVGYGRVMAALATGSVSRRPATTAATHPPVCDVGTAGEAADVDGVYTAGDGPTLPADVCEGRMLARCLPCVR